MAASEDISVRLREKDRLRTGRTGHLFSTRTDVTAIYSLHEPSTLCTYLGPRARREGVLAASEDRCVRLREHVRPRAEELSAFHPEPANERSKKGVHLSDSHPPLNWKSARTPPKTCEVRGTRCIHSSVRPRTEELPVFHPERAKSKGADLFVGSFERADSFVGSSALKLRNCPHFTQNLRTIRGTSRCIG